MKLMQFLIALYDSYNQVNSQISIMEPVPNVKTDFSVVSREDSNQKHGSISIWTNSNHSSAFFGKLNDVRKFKTRNYGLDYKNYGLKGHRIKKCYKLIGYPKDYKPRVEFNKTSYVSGTTSNVSDTCNISFVLLIR